MKPEKNRKILDAAQVEFKNRGLEAASMEKIAKEAGVSKRTLYNYYPEKPLLYNAMLEDISKALELTS